MYIRMRWSVCCRDRWVRGFFFVFPIICQADNLKKQLELNFFLACCDRLRDFWEKSSRKCVLVLCFGVALYVDVFELWRIVESWGRVDSTVL